MLHFLRNSAQSWFFKIIFILIIVGFAGWGLSGIFTQNAQNQPIAHIGHKTVTQQSLYQDFQRNLSQFEKSYGSQPLSDKNIVRALLTQSLDQIITHELFVAQSEKSNLLVTEPIAIDQLRKNPAFKNETGQFDPFIIEQILHKNQISESDFMQQVKKDIAVQMLIKSISTQVALPPQILENAYKIDHQNRSGSYIFIPLAATSSLKAPTDDELKEFMDERVLYYQTPELRDIEYITFSKKSIAQSISIVSADLKEIYKQNITLYSIPETRDMSQLVFETAEKAEKFLSLIRSGQGFDQASSSLKLSPISLQNLSANDIIFENLSNWAFASQVKDVSPAFYTSIGYVVAQINKITPPHIKTFDTVEPQIRKEQLTKAVEEKLESIQHMIDDQITQNKSLQEIAQSSPLVEFKAVPRLARSGQIFEQDKFVPSKLPAKILEQGFALNEQEESLIFQDDNDQYYLVKTTKITEPFVMDFNAIRQKVEQDWRKDFTKKQTQALTAALEEKANSTGLLSNVATSNPNLIYKTINKLGLKQVDAQKNNLPPETVLEQFFTRSKGEIFTQETELGTYLVQVTLIENPREITQEMTEPYQQAIQQSFQNDILGLFKKAYIKDLNVKTNQKAIESLQSHLSQ